MNIKNFLVKITFFTLTINKLFKECIILLKMLFYRLEAAPLETSRGGGKVDPPLNFNISFF